MLRTAIRSSLDVGQPDFAECAAWNEEASATLTTSKPLFFYLQRPDNGEWVTAGRYQGDPGPRQCCAAVLADAHRFGFASKDEAGRYLDMLLTRITSGFDQAAHWLDAAWQETLRARMQQTVALLSLP